jgi:hypothetical protein
VLLQTQLAKVRADSLLRPFSFISRTPVRIWDIVGEDQVLKGEYKVISGKMYGLRYYFFAFLITRDQFPATTSSGTARANASSPLVTGKKSGWPLWCSARPKWLTWSICWGGGTHFKIWPCIHVRQWFFDRRDPRPLEGAVPGACMCVLMIEGTITSSQVVNAVAIRRQRPFRAATAGDDNLIIFHQGNAIAA